MKKLVISFSVLVIFFIGITTENKVLANEEYTISNANELLDFAQEVNNGNTFINKTVKLTEDIDLKGNETNQWIPIGTAKQCAFEGIFEGNGHIISGIYINNSKYSNIGLFGYNKGTIQNIGLSNSYIDIKNSKKSVNVGNIAGYNAGTIQYCYNDSKIDTEINYDSAYTYIGGISR